MANATIDIKEDVSPTKKLASQSFTRGVDTVHQEEVAIGDGTTDGRIVTVTAANALKVDGSAVNQPVTDAGGALTVDAIDLDIRNLATGQDKVDIRQRDAADASFIDPVIKAQLPAALVGGRLSVDASGVAVPVTDNAGTLTVDQATASNLNAQVVGELANDAVDSGNPIKVGGKASGVLPTAVADADRVNAYHDREGRQIVRPWGAGEWTQVHFPSSNTQATATKTAGGAGVRIVCTGLTVVLAGGTTAPAAIQVDVKLRDGAGGTILWQAVVTLPAVAGAMNGISRSGLHIKGTANTAMVLEFSAAGGANTFESVSFEGVSITEA